MSYDVYWVKNRAEKITDFEHPTCKGSSNVPLFFLQLPLQGALVVCICLPRAMPRAMEDIGLSCLGKRQSRVQPVSLFLYSITPFSG